MRLHWIPLNLLLTVFLLCSSSAVYATETSTSDDVPHVVASIAPVHGLVARVMAGVGVPDLLISQTVSPHDYSLKPSDARLLNSADVVFWIGPQLEKSLNKPLQTLAKSAQVASLLKDRDRGVNLLSRRKGGVQGQADAPLSITDPDSADPHIWLNPQNAAAMMLNIAEVLAGIDPVNANEYLSNALDGALELEVLSRNIVEQLAQVVTDGPAIVFFHDAYQYFEQRFGIKPTAIIQVDPDHAPGARRVAEIRAAIKRAGSVCVFSEPQYNPKLIATLIEGTQAIHGLLDPVGVDIPLGVGFYEAMMRAFVENFVGCLR